tara:strand:+ start:382 stop:519 length:138 start_codon:yes stop_codon:yes gene_type:complete
MSKMSELYIKYMEENYNNLSEEEKEYLKSINQEYIYWEQNDDNSP